MNLVNKKKSHGAKSELYVGWEALRYYIDPKIPSQRMMCDLAHCRGEGTTCLQFHGRRAQHCFSNAQVPVGKMFDSQSVWLAQTPCEQFPLNKKMLSLNFTLDLLIRVFFFRGAWEVCQSELCIWLWNLTRKPKFHLRLSLAAESLAHFSHDPRVSEKPTHEYLFVHRTNFSGPVYHKFFSCAGLP